MKSGLSNVKKFQFFEIINEAKEGENFLENVSPLQMHAIDQTIFLSAKVKVVVNNSLKNENYILKIIKNKIIDQYVVHTNTNFFLLNKFNSKYYFITLGNDIKDFPTPEGKKNLKMLTMIKFFEINKLLEPSYLCADKKIDNFLIKQINLLKNFKDNSFYLGKDYPENMEPILNVLSFSISSDFQNCAVGLDKGQVILINTNTNLVDCGEKNMRIRFLTVFDPDMQITNLSFSKTQSGKDDFVILYCSTPKSIFFYRINDKKEEIEILDENSGAYSGCMAAEEDKLLVASNFQPSITEYHNLEMGPSWFFEGKKQHISYFKNYVVFVIFEDKNCTLAIYDKTNSFYSYNNNNFNKINCICTEGDHLYAFVETTSNNKQIIKLKEKDNKTKFEIFYRKSFFDNAFEYAKNLNYDQKKISEISRRHGDHLYQKGDFSKSIEQYILTINNLEPSYVIQKFLDGVKLDYLILYLEALEKDEQFKLRENEEIQYYTSLLLNCYIKQKQTSKLQDFVNRKNISAQSIDIRTAIEVCKDTGETDLALSIAEKANIIDYYLEILIDIKKNYALALEFIERIKDTSKKFDFIMEYGQKFLAETPVKMQAFLKNFINNTIQLRKQGNDSLIKIENIIKIYLNQEQLLEDLLDFILQYDDNCHPTIIHRRIELYLDRLNNLSNNEEVKRGIVEQIISLLKNKKYLNIDKSYLLMLFKMHNFTKGIIILSEFLELRQELLSIYMDCHEYDKIISICENFGRTVKIYLYKENNFWIQALNYFISNERDEKNENYIKQILNKISENALLSPILVLEILKKKGNVKYETVKNFIVSSLKKEKTNLDVDKTEFESNFSKLEKIKVEVSELKHQARIFRNNKCNLCAKQLAPPMYYFLCMHGFHSHCLNSEGRDDTKDMQCPSCQQKNIQITQRIKQAEEQAKDHNNFVQELNSKQRKFDLIAKYYGRGIFKIDK